MSASVAVKNIVIGAGRPKICIPVFRRSTRKIPAFSYPHFLQGFLYPSIFPVFTANFQCPLGAFFIEKNFLLCYNNSTL